MESEWDTVWGCEWRISSMASKHHHASKCVYDILSCQFWCGLFDMEVETFWCCLKTLFLSPSNGCNTWPHFHPHSWAHTPSLVPHPTLELSPYSDCLLIFDLDSVLESSLPQLGTPRYPWDLILPCAFIQSAFTLSVTWKPIPDCLHSSLSFVLSLAFTLWVQMAMLNVVCDSNTSHIDILFFPLSVGKSYGIRRVWLTPHPVTCAQVGKKGSEEERSCWSVGGTMLFIYLSVHPNTWIHSDD